jgi:hypothetical protein
MANEIDVRLDRGEYVGGDTLYGSVYLRIQQQLSSSTLKLVIRGLHTCKYGYKYLEQGEEEGDFTSRVGQRNMIKDIIKQEIVIGEGLFPIGCYAYPFKYQLPHSLPGSFVVQYEDMDSSKSWEGVVQYSVSAVLTSGSPHNKISKESRMVVYDSIECRSSEAAPQPLMAHGSVRTFFCLTRGTVNVTCSLQNTAFTPSSKIILSLKIKNDSSVDVSGYTVNLLRVVKLQALDRMRDEEELSTHNILTTVLESEGRGCPHNNNISHDVELNLTAAQNIQSVGVPPNTSSSLVKCNYVIDVNIHVPWGPDIELRQPLLIKAADNDNWKSWTPPSWIEQCVKARTSGITSVSDNLLNSQIFSGIPGFRPEL